jgi:L-seryl-tRNA(Ser) seleniumtransferase
MLHTTLETLEERATNLKERLKDTCNCEIIKTQTMIGGGTTPNKKIPSIALSLEVENYKANKLEELLRKNNLISRIENDRVILDFRTILEDEIEKIEIILKNLFTKCN